MGCATSREKSFLTEDTHFLNPRDRSYIKKILVLRMNYEKYSFKSRRDPEDAFNDITRSWGKLAKNVAEKSFPNLSEEFKDTEEEEEKEVEEPQPTISESDAKLFLRKNTIALKNLEVVQSDISPSVPVPPKLSFSKLLIDKIKEVNIEKNEKGLIKTNTLENIKEIITNESRPRRTKVSFDLLTKK